MGRCYSERRHYLRGKGYFGDTHDSEGRRYLEDRHCSEVVPLGDGVPLLLSVSLRWEASSGDILSYPMSQSLAGLLRGSELCWKLRGSVENRVRYMLAIPLGDSSEYTTNEKKLVEADDLAKDLLILNISDDILMNINSCETAKDLWDEIQKKMQGT
ncbi:hypothetical protein Tco_0529536 [Tanacetum coccineum]